MTLQQKLKTLGFDTGTADGVIGRRTVAAVKSYQAAHGLIANGVVDRSLVDHVLNQPSR